MPLRQYLPYILIGLGIIIGVTFLIISLTKSKTSPPPPPERNFAPELEYYLSNGDGSDLDHAMTRIVQGVSAIDKGQEMIFNILNDIATAHNLPDQTTFTNYISADYQVFNLELFKRSEQYIIPYQEALYQYASQTGLTLLLWPDMNAFGQRLKTFIHDVSALSLSEQLAIADYTNVAQQYSVVVTDMTNNKISKAVIDQLPQPPKGFQFALLPTGELMYYIAYDGVDFTFTIASPINGNINFPNPPSQVKALLSDRFIELVRSYLPTVSQQVYTCVANNIATNYSYEEASNLTQPDVFSMAENCMTIRDRNNYFMSEFVEMIAPGGYTAYLQCLLDYSVVVYGKDYITTTELYQRPWSTATLLKIVRGLGQGSGMCPTPLSDPNFDDNGLNAVGRFKFKVLIKFTTVTQSQAWFDAFSMAVREFIVSCINITSDKVTSIDFVQFVGITEDISTGNTVVIMDFTPSTSSRVLKPAAAILVMLDEASKPDSPFMLGNGTSWFTPIYIDKVYGIELMSN